MSGTGSRPGSPGLLLHAAAGSDLPAVLRSAANAAAALPAGTAVEVVVQGPLVVRLSAGTDLSETISDLHTKSVRILACRNSLRSAGLEAEDLEAGIGTVPAAVSYLAQQQWGGWAYIRP